MPRASADRLAYLRVRRCHKQLKVLRRMLDDLHEDPAPWRAGLIAEAAEDLAERVALAVVPLVGEEGDDDA
jgi:hypothetical protein